MNKISLSFCLKVCAPPPVFCHPNMLTQHSRVLCSHTHPSSVSGWSACSSALPVLVVGRLFAASSSSVQVGSVCLGLGQGFLSVCVPLLWAAKLSSICSRSCAGESFLLLLQSQQISNNFTAFGAENSCLLLHHE